MTFQIKSRLYGFATQAICMMLSLHLNLKKDIYIKECLLIEEHVYWISVLNEG